MKYNKLIDHTLLKQDATPEQILKLCEEAKEHDFMSVCVNPAYVPLAAEALKGSDVKVCTVIGFPLGMNLPKTKVKKLNKPSEKARMKSIWSSTLECLKLEMMTTSKQK